MKKRTVCHSPGWFFPAVPVRVKRNSLLLQRPVFASASSTLFSWRGNLQLPAVQWQDSTRSARLGSPITNVVLTSQTERRKRQQGTKQGCWQHAVPVPTHAPEHWQYELKATNTSNLSTEVNILDQIWKCDLYEFPVLALMALTSGGAELKLITFSHNNLQKHLLFHGLSDYAAGYKRECVSLWFLFCTCLCSCQHHVYVTFFWMQHLNTLCQTLTSQIRTCLQGFHLPCVMAKYLEKHRMMSQEYWLIPHNHGQLLFHTWPMACVLGGT